MSNIWEDFRWREEEEEGQREEEEMKNVPDAFGLPVRCLCNSVRICCCFYIPACICGLFEPAIFVTLPFFAYHCLFVPTIAFCAYHCLFVPFCMLYWHCVHQQ